MPSTDPGHIPGPVIIPTCIQVRLQWLTPSGRLAFNVTHAAAAGGFTPTVAIANAILSGLNGSGTFTTLAAFLSTDAALSGVSLLDMRTAANSPVDSNGGPGSGTSANDVLAPATSLVVTERTAHAGPGFRGRMYIPGWTSAAMDTGAVVDPAAVTALAAWAATIPTVYGASGLTMGIAQPARAAYTGATGTAHAARAAHVEPVTSLSVRNAFWDSQRRRGGRT